MKAIYLRPGEFTIPGNCNATDLFFEFQCLFYTSKIIAVTRHESGEFSHFYRISAEINEAATHQIVSYLNENIHTYL